MKAESTILFEKPPPGFTIQVICIDPHDGRGRRESFFGTVTASEEDDPEHTFRLSTGLPKYFQFPERLIPLSHVVDLIYASDDHKVPVRREVMRVDEHFDIVSSDGVTIYSTDRKSGQWTCTCPGFHYRGNCRHITEGKKQLQEEQRA